MEIDWENLSLDELKSVKKRVEKEIANFEARRKKEAISALRSKASELGFSLNELVDDSKRSVSKSPAKFVHPENPEVTWTGRGRQPKWFKEALESGRTEEELLIG